MGHIRGVKKLVVERRNRGIGSGPLNQEVIADRDADESDESLAESLAEAALSIIRRDSVVPRSRNSPIKGQIGPWEGVVLLYTDAKKAVATLPILIEDPSSEVSAEAEMVAMAGELRKTFAAMAQGVVTIYGALGRREKHQAKMFKAMATGQAQLSKSASKWKFKERQAHEETEQADIAARERTAKRKFFWEAVESIGVEWKDVGEIWSKYYTMNRAPGDPKKKPPVKPTPEECAKVFGGPKHEIFEKQYPCDDGEMRSLRSIVGEMIAEPDLSRRHQLAKLLVQVGAKIPDSKSELQAAFLGAGLLPERIMEIVAWLSLPITF